MNLNELWETYFPDTALLGVAFQSLLELFCIEPGLVDAWVLSPPQPEFPLDPWLLSPQLDELFGWLLRCMYK
jgi:hypothetical protein